MAEGVGNEMEMPRQGQEISFDEVHIQDPHAGHIHWVVPKSVDLYVLERDGKLKVAKSPAVDQLTPIIDSLNSSSSDQHNEQISGNTSVALCLLRFEVPKQSGLPDPPLEPEMHGSPGAHSEQPRARSPLEETRQLIPYELDKEANGFDWCCNDNIDQLSLILRKSDSHCQCSGIKLSGPNDQQCIKFSYSLASPDQKYLILSHHFHLGPSLDGPQLKGMIRGFAVGINRNCFEDILSRSMIFRDQARTTGSPELHTPHPKAILLSILEDFEVDRRKEINAYSGYLQRIQDEIGRQRSDLKRKGNGLAKCIIQLSETNINLSQVRPKLQYLASSIAMLESCIGVPESTGRLSFDTISNTDSGSPPPADGRQPSQFWTRQLSDIRGRLLCLKVKCDQCGVDVEILQHRLTGSQHVVSNLLSHREIDWIHKKKKYQTEMLKRQDQISQRIKSDSTVTKVVGLLTAFFLPGTFIAILFTVPVFDWTKDYPIGPHFVTYWLFTAPITSAIFLGFLIWFAWTWWKDRSKSGQGQRKKKDVEQAGRARRSSVSDAETSEEESEKPVEENGHISRRLAPSE